MISNNPLNNLSTSNNSTIRRDLDNGLKQLINRLKRKHPINVIKEQFQDILSNNEAIELLFEVNEDPRIIVTLPNPRFQRKRSRLAENTTANRSQRTAERIVEQTMEIDEESVGTVDENYVFRNTDHCIRVFEENRHSIMETDTTIREFCDKAIRDIGEPAKLLHIVKTLDQIDGDQIANGVETNYEEQDLQTYVVRSGEDLKTFNAKMVVVNGKRYRLQDMESFVLLLKKWNMLEGKKNLVVVLLFKWCLDYLGEQEIENGMIKLNSNEIVEFLEDLNGAFQQCNYDSAMVKELNNRIKEALQHGPKLLLFLRILYPWLSFERVVGLKTWYHIRRVHMGFFEKVCIPILVRIRSNRTGLATLNFEQDSFFATFDFDFALSRFLDVHTTWNIEVDLELRNAVPLTMEQRDAFENRLVINPRPVHTMYEDIEVWEINERFEEEEENVTDTEN
jgi:hypothetical protein